MASIVPKPSISLTKRGGSIGPSLPPTWIETLARRVRAWLVPCTSFRTVFEEATAGIMMQFPLSPTLSGS